MRTARLTRSTFDRIFGGVCGGIGNYLGIDGWWLRIALVALAITTFGFGVLTYVLLWLLIPGAGLAELAPIGGDRPARYPQPETVLLIGAGAIAVGVVVLIQINGVFQGFNGDLIVPGMLLAVGLVILVKQIGGQA